MAQEADGVTVAPTADVHPTVVIEGSVSIGEYSKIGAGTVLTGDITIGHHSLVQCNVTIRGDNEIGNYTHIYDDVCIEGGRPADVGSSTTSEGDDSIIGDGIWVNHGATMHGTRIEDGAAVGLNACCDYNTRIREGAILANGSATRVDQEIPADGFAEGVPAEIQRTDITDDDRADYFGLIPSEWNRYWAERRDEESE